MIKRLKLKLKYHFFNIQLQMLEFKNRYRIKKIAYKIVNINNKSKQRLIFNNFLENEKIPGSYKETFLYYINEFGGIKK